MNKTELRRIIANYEAMRQPEPCRPLTWAELMKVRKTTPLYIEHRDSRFPARWCLFALDKYLKRDMQRQKTDYNRTYRYWPRVPTRRERKAAKWEA